MNQSQVVCVAGRRGLGPRRPRRGYQFRRASMETAWKAGLEDVIAARSAICQADGVNGRLYYRGYEIGDIAGAVSFEDVTALLWHGEIPDAQASATFKARLEGARGLPPAVGDLLPSLPRGAHPPHALRPPAIPPRARTSPRPICAKRFAS